MEYRGKHLYAEAPSAADGDRRDYVAGIDSYLARLRADSGGMRDRFMSSEALKSDPDHFRAEYRRMLGLDRLADPASHADMQKIGEDDRCEIYRLRVVALEIPFYGMLLLPKGAVSPFPLVIAQHGGGGTPALCADFSGKNNYSHMVQRLLDRGAAVLLPQLLLWSQKETETQRAHPVPYDRGAVDRELKRFGTSITALEIFMISKCLDHVLTRRDIHPEKVGMIGLSYGGYFTLYTMAADTRIRAGYAAGAFNDRNAYPWQDFCYFSSATRFHDAEVAALCAPRRLFLQVGKEDGVFDWRTALPELDRARGYFDALGCPQSLKVSLWEGGHTISPDEAGYDFLFSAFSPS